MELYLKSAEEQLEWLINLPISKGRNQNHELKPLAKKVFAAMKNYSYLNNPDWIDLEHKIEDLVAIDPKGETFRFAKTKKENSPTIQFWGTYNVATLLMIALEVLEKLDDMCSWLADLCDQKSKALVP